MKNRKLTETSVNADEIAAFLGLTAKRIRQLAGENRIPAPDATDNYPLAATVQKYCEFLRQRAESGTITSARRRRLEAQAGIAEMELAKKRGELVSIKAVGLVWTARKTAVRHVIEQSSLSKREQEAVLAALAVKSIDEYVPVART